MRGGRGGGALVDELNTGPPPHSAHAHARTQALPGAPSLAALKLPPFRAPLLDSELPFIEPEYAALPEVGNPFS